MCALPGGTECARLILQIVAPPALSKKYQIAGLNRKNTFLPQRPTAMILKTVRL